MAAIDLSINVPSIDELVGHWSLTMRPRTWDLDIMGNRYVISYIPSAVETEVWSATTAAHGCVTHRRPTFDELMLALATEWHLAICTAAVAEQVKQAVVAASHTRPRPALEPRTDPADADGR